MYDLGRTGFGDGTNGIGIGAFGRDGIDNYRFDSLTVYNNTIVAKAGSAPNTGFRIANLSTASANAVTNINVKNNIFSGFAGNWCELSYANPITNINISYNDAYNNGNSNAIYIPNGTPTNYTHTNNITANPTVVG